MFQLLGLAGVLSETKKFKKEAATCPAQPLLPHSLSLNRRPNESSVPVAASLIPDC